MSILVADFLVSNLYNFWELVSDNVFVVSREFIFFLV